MLVDFSRREAIAIAIGATAPWLLTATAQTGIPVVGYLSSGSAEAEAFLVMAFRKGLSEAGYVDGRNVIIEFRWARMQFDILPILAADLVRRHVAVIATPFQSRAALVAKEATSTIPVIFSNGIDPVQFGLVASFNRPGGNVTGATGWSADLSVKRLELLHRVLPGTEHFAVFISPDMVSGASIVEGLQEASPAFRKHIEAVTVHIDTDLDKLFASLVQRHVEALIVSPGLVFNERRTQIAALAVRHLLPTIFPFREDAKAGALMSYGNSAAENARLAGVYAGRVLSGAKPADLPVLRATRLELVINLSTAKALGLTMPQSLLALADEVIE
jgi:putative tryptophan/tyrosine transport system substrate-binding protein